MLHRILWAGALAGLASDDAVGRPAALRRSLVRHHPLCRIHEVRQPRLRSARHERAERRRRGLRRRGDARVSPAAIALVGNVAYTQPGLEIGAPLIGGVSVGQSSVLLYDAALRLRVPVGMGGLPISPFVQGGAGTLRQSFDIGPASTHSTNFAYNVGAGADVALGSAARPAADGEGLHREVRRAGGDRAQRRHQDDAQLRGERGAAAGACSEPASAVA